MHLDDAKAIGLLERAVRMAPNAAAAHKALGRAYVEDGREAEGYAELVIALMLNPDDVETLTALGRWHLTSDSPNVLWTRSNVRSASIRPTGLPSMRWLVL